MAKKINVNELARRYTTAAFALASASKKLDVVASDLAGIQSQLSADEGAIKLLSSPLLTAEKQVAFAREFGKKIGANDITLNFLLIVARNRRLKYLPQIIAEFQNKIAAEKNEATAVVTSSQKLDDAELKQIADNLSKKTGKKINIKEVVNSAIIGGLIVQIGSVMFDNSIRTKLNRLAANLKKAS